MAEKEVYFKEIYDKNEWAEYLNSLQTADVYSSWLWGEYKQRIGWNVRRICVWDIKDDTLVACFQLQKKVKLKLFNILLIQGGIHLKKLSDNNYHKVLESLMVEYVLNKKLAILFINHQSRSSQDVELGLLRSNFTPILNTKSYTYVLDINQKALSQERLSKNWRRNLKRALNNSKLSYHWVTDVTERKRAFGDMERFYSNLMSRKKFGAALNTDSIKDLLIESDDFRIIEARLENKVIAVRIGAFGKDSVLDFLAASDELAKNTYANYLLLYKLIESANSEEKSHFDCGGINPGENMGVFNFKKGLGGRLAINGPIWLNASSNTIKKITRILFSFGV